MRILFLLNLLQLRLDHIKRGEYHSKVNKPLFIPVLRDILYKLKH